VDTFMTARVRRSPLFQNNSRSREEEPGILCRVFSFSRTGS
jgi:hypothetical protein